MKKLLSIGALALFMATPAVAADMAVKNPLAPVASGYPYGSSGWIFGLYTEGGGSLVNGASASAVGANPNGLVELNGGGGFTLGYAWGQKGSPFAYSIEGDIGGTNFNGSSQGLSVSGPLEAEVRLVLWTPYANLAQYLPNLPAIFNTTSLPPFSLLPTGVTANNVQLGIFGGAHGNDISLNFQGLSSNKEFRIAPEVGLMQMEQLSNGFALRTYIKDVLAQSALTVGPIPSKQASAGLTNQLLVGAGVDW
jgi:hypothetical protein